MADDEGSGRPQRYWLWVAGPDYYLENGEHHPQLEAGAGYDPSAWWTCDPDVRVGDLVLLYRSKKDKKIAQVLIVRSDPDVIDDPDSPFHGWHACSYEVIKRLRHPVPFATIVADSQLQHWGPVKLRFVRSSFPVPAEHWARLIGLGGETVEGIADLAGDGLHRIRLEREVQQHLIDHPALLDRAGYAGLDLVRAEHRFPNGRRADLLYMQGRGLRRRHVVVELKRGPVTTRAVDQVLCYRQLLDEDARWRGRRARAVLVGDTVHPDADRRIRRSPRLDIVLLSELGLALRPAPITAEKS